MGNLVRASTELERLFEESERQVTVQNYRVGCILGIIFMPAGATLDYFVYRDETWPFLQLRFLCSVLLGVIWLALKSPFGLRHYRWLGLVEVSLPLFFISWMIYVTEGADSPYYAGLNLVLMGAGIVLRWGLWDSIAVFLLAMGMYLTACLLHGPVRLEGHFYNNLYFLFVTGVFIITGNYFYNRLRFQEFSVRYELDQNRARLEETNRKLVELDRVKSRFFANISHELRTPLTLLLAPLESLQNRRLHLSSEEINDLLRTMHTNGMRLLKLINDLLDLVRLESGRMEVRRESLDVNSFIRGLVQSVRRVADDKRVRMETVLDDTIGALQLDRDKLEKILLNLLFNSIKFTPAGGRVLMRSKRDGEYLQLTVEDSGMGISEDQLPFIFDRFWQADSSSQRKYQGAGIGLALVKEFVEVQGGKVTVQSTPGKGTIMNVYLPWQEMPEEGRPASASAESGNAATSPSPPPEGADEWLVNLYRRAELFPAMTPLKETLRQGDALYNGTRPKVLVADDEPDMLRFLKSQLSPHYQVIEAVDGQQAIESAAQFLPEVILLDMMMPEKDGLQVCRELHARLPTQNIPILLLTARADEETKLSALQAGASDFLTKPFSTTELHVRLKNLLDSHQFQRKLARQNQILEATLEQLKETETQLVQSEKLASLGRMSAGLIHEINNPLNFAKTALFMLRKKQSALQPEEQADFQEILHDIEEGLDRVKNIVADLRTFTHPNMDAFESVDVAAAVATALRFVSHECKAPIHVEKEVGEGLTIWGNRNQIIQVLVNLLQNALDALRTKSFTNEKPTLWLTAQAEGGKTRLAIKDNGPGIAPENLPRIFDPFFTTKDIGEGMGLGLTICYRIVQNHGGKIRARSDPGEFTEIEIEFPSAQ
ncbi:MAG: ATP-binding protein [Verrucomicrobiota bacterium]